MKVTKIKRDVRTNYLRVSKHILRDKRVSLKARGFFVTVMSLAPNWKYSIAGLEALQPGGRDVVYSSINELIEHGYVARRTIRKGRRIAEYEYIFDELGEANLEADCLVTEKAESEDSQETESQETESQETVNPTQLIPNSGLNSSSKNPKEREDLYLSEAERWIRLARKSNPDVDEKVVEIAVLTTFLQRFESGVTQRIGSPKYFRPEIENITHSRLKPSTIDAMLQSRRQIFAKAAAIMARPAQPTADVCARIGAEPAEII